MKELGNWMEVDTALEEMSRLSIEILAVEARLGLRVLDLMNEYGQSLDSLHRRKRDIESRIEGFCGSRKAEFAEKRSRRLTFGKIAFRLAEKIEIPDGMENVAIRTLKGLGWDECVEVKESLNKPALKRLSDAHLAMCGLKRTVADRLRIEPNLRLAAEKSGKAWSPPAVTIDRERLSGAVKVAAEEGPSEAADG